MVEDRVIAEHLTNLLTPTIKSQSRHFRELGLRDRILTLPLMVAAVLTLLWRDVPGVTELTRLLETPIVTLRLIEVRVGKSWRSYLTSVLDPEILPPFVVIDLYQKRWRIEDAFNIVKRLLGLSYLWTGSINGIKLRTRLPRRPRQLVMSVQIWATWLFYAVLVDLGDAVADELSLPFDLISLEMVYRDLYYFHGAAKRGETQDPVKYFANPDIQKCLGIVKRQRKLKKKLIIAPFPDKQRGDDQFFFQYPSKLSLTASLQA